MKQVRLRLCVAFEGTAYQGWQTQKIGQGIQERVERALRALFPGAGALHASSRTDSGVHALGLVAHVDVPSSEWRMTPRKLVLAVNAHLPEDVRVLACSRVSTRFHARFDAAGKQYRYCVWNAPAMNPLQRRTAWHVPRPLDLESMRLAAGHFVGRHDFASMTSNPGYARDSTVRTVTRCDIRGRGPEVTVIIEGDGFLYKMCRGIAGTLIQVGLGKTPPSAIPAILDGKDRRIAGVTAPAHGLVLWRVSYRHRAARDEASRDSRS